MTTAFDRIITLTNGQYMITDQDRKSTALKNALTYPKKVGKADYIRYLEGEHLTRDEAIKATCYECVGGEATDPCKALCPLTLYSQWNASKN